MAKLIPTALERQKIFYHLKKCSSYTAWSRVLNYYKIWAELFEKSAIEISDSVLEKNESAINTQKLIAVLKGLSTCEKCVALLLDGNKSPFRYDGLTCFAVADRPKAYWGEFMWRLEIGEGDLDPESTPYWVEICNALEDLGGAWSEIARDILDPPDTDDASVFALDETDREYYFNGKRMLDGDKVFLPHYFPHNLLEVPEPNEVVLVQNGEDVPFSGIYEPIKSPSKTNTVSMFSNENVHSGPFEVIGSMNYLHANSRATHIGDGRDPISTTWRLIWKDDRYLDGSIPAEEADYVFNKPSKKTLNLNTGLPNSGDAVIFAQTGERAVKAGVWAVQEDLHARQTFAAGDVLPPHNHRNVTWVWSEA
jgi:Immunity protein 71/Immunity protein 72